MALNRIIRSLGAGALAVLPWWVCDAQRIRELEEDVPPRPTCASVFEPDGIWQESDGGHTLEYKPAHMGHQELHDHHRARRQDDGAAPGAGAAPVRQRCSRAWTRRPCAAWLGKPAKQMAFVLKQETDGTGTGSTRRAAKWSSP